MKIRLDSEDKDLIKDLKIGKNTQGQVVIGFKSDKHKYFEFGFGSSSWWGSGRAPGEHWVQVIYLDVRNCDGEIEAHGEIQILPESEEEEDVISGVWAKLPLKWEYMLVCVPWEHFEFDTAQET
jgi:hypothetical protein